MPAIVPIPPRDCAAWIAAGLLGMGSLAAQQPAAPPAFKGKMSSTVDGGNRWIRWVGQESNSIDPAWR